jgi:hypothetical protein
MVGFIYISLAGDLPVLMEARECEFNVTALLGLKTTGFGRPLYGFYWLFLPVLDKLCSTTSRVK